MIEASKDTSPTLYELFSGISPSLPEVELSTLRSSGEVTLDKILRAKRLEGLSDPLFGSYIRLPLLGLIRNLTPEIEIDTFYVNQVATALGYDRGNTHREVKKYIELGMVRPVAVPKKAYKEFVRLGSAKWDIIDAALSLDSSELS